MSRVLCRPGPHAPPAARLSENGKAYVLNRDREYWVDAGCVEANSFWVPVEPDETLDELRGSVSGSDSSDAAPNPSPSQTTEGDETAAQGSTDPSSLVGEDEDVPPVCGAEKSNGEPCQRATNGGRCWQHDKE